jgi:peptidyl-prolyl cis-trans isomerase B (cyclophilin B)
MNVTKKVMFETNKGNILIGLYGEEMPITVENFVNHVEKGFYTKLLFHRVIKDFVIQGGGMLKGMMEKASISDPIKLEICPEILHKKYVLSMARTQDPNSATSQFFICTGDVPSLDGQYAAFGAVLEGQEVVDEIGNAETHSVKWHDDVPKEHIFIEKASVVE